jgi:Holliday junction DNA helicase RuvA
VIGRLSGSLAERNVDGSCVVDVGGVGYEVFVPIGTLGRLPMAPEPIVLHVHTHVREDALTLFGFANESDRAAFRALLSVSNVGPKLALAIMSAMDANELAAAIASQDPARWKGIPGVGKRTAERVILELKDKLTFTSSMAAPSTLPSRPRVDASGAPLGQLASVLVGMGWKNTEADRAVAAIAPDAAGKSMETLLREALAQLG